jgi:hypothetical protein
VNLKFANTEMVAMKIRNRRAQAAPEKPPKPAAGPMMPPSSFIHPQVLAFRAIQRFALSLYEVPLTMPTKPHSIQSAPPMIRKTRATTAHAVLPYADVLAHRSLSFQIRLATIMAVVWAILTPGVGSRGADASSRSLATRPPEEPHPQRVGSWPSSAMFSRY